MSIPVAYRLLPVANWDLNPAPAITVPGLSLPAATSPFSNSGSIKYIYGAELARKFSTGTLVGFGNLSVPGWHPWYNLSIYSIDPGNRSANKRQHQHQRLV
jgi:hypothetical protein